MAEPTTLTTSTPSTTPTTKPKPRDRDSGVFLSDTKDLINESIPTSSPNQSSLHRCPSTTTTQTPSRPPPTSTPTPHRLHTLRPTGLNLSSSNPTSNPKPSSSQPRIHLKSPNSLLRARLNLSPKEQKKNAPIRTFTPPRPAINGCIMPAPQEGVPGFRGTGITARTERGMKAWWCRVDRVVIFDGILESSSGRREDIQFLTRSCKGLRIARMRGDDETLVVPLDCAHCRDMLGRMEWKYDVRVCKRSVCWECSERCLWELGRETEGGVDVDVVGDGAVEAGGGKAARRDRADSVLQDCEGDDCRMEELGKKVGIEMEGPGLIEFLGGIDERLEALVA